MANYGVTEQGFVLKRLPEILTDDRQQAVSVMQDLVEPGDTVDVSDSSALGRLISLKAPSVASLWEALQQTYSAFDPNSATGIALDNLAAIAGISPREEQTFSTVPLAVYGDNNTLIPIGSVVRSDSNNRFTLVAPAALSNTLTFGITVVINSVSNSTVYSISYTNNSTTSTITYTSDSNATEVEILSGLKLTIDSAHPTLTASVEGSSLKIEKLDKFQSLGFSSSSNISITKAGVITQGVSEVPGPISQEANTINTIVTPVLGWDSVTNPVAATPGKIRETDAEFRKRFRVSKFDRGTNSTDAIYSALVGVDNVKEVVVYENDTDEVDSNGLPPHSFEPIVLGGNAIDIANAIWNNKPAGIESVGNTSGTIVDAQGFTKIVKYQTPSPVVIYISMNLTTNENFPANGIDQIKNQLTSYFSENFGIGDMVVYSRLYTPINTVSGHQVNSLTIGTSPSPSATSNIPIAFDKIASLSDINIQITTT